jgi:hypothetical protein
MSNKTPVVANQLEQVGGRMKVMILGHGRHGKDTVAEMLRDLIGLTFISSSWAAAEKAVFPWLSQLYGYTTVQECFDDRANHREEWRQLITDYNTPDKGKLCREILEVSDCYVGMRCRDEFAAVRHLFDVVIWVEADQRRPIDPTMSIERESGMYLIDNNCRKSCLKPQVALLAVQLLAGRAA